MTIYRVATIGLGTGRRHIDEAWCNLPGKFELAVACDLDPARRELANRDYHCETSDDFDAVIARDDIDIVDICTPPALHLPQVKAALAAGKQVICEKPLAGSLNDIDEMALAEAQSTGVLMPIFQYRYGAGALAAKEIIATGLAGKGLVATAETHWYRDSAYFDNPWRGSLKAELGGTMTTHAIHIHDMLSWLMGPVRAVFGRIDTRAHPIETEDCASGTLRFDSGAFATVSASSASQDEYSRLFLAFENVTFESTRAPYDVGSGPWKITSRDPEVQEKCDEIAKRFEDAPSRFAGQMSAFYTTLEAGAPPPVTVADARASISLLTAFYLSTQLAQEVLLPLAANDPARAGWRSTALADAG
ncbi:MAG: Gfo/Idh/MocA family oxidoreductase [Rhodobacteraceae bacterium]|nr:Gfo/Idh/MocA family oxidoreductase [Paracoccaceae bacterium]